MIKQFIVCILMLGFVVSSLSCTIPPKINSGSVLAGTCDIELEDVTACCLSVSQDSRILSIYPEGCDRASYLKTNYLNPQGDIVTFAMPIDYAWGEGTYNASVTCWSNSTSETDANEIDITQPTDLNFLVGWTKFATDNMRFLPVFVLLCLGLWLVL